MAGKLTVPAVKALTAEGKHRPGRHTDGDGLHLHIRPSGDAAWVLRYRLHGKQRDLSVGTFPAVSLKDARTAAEAARALVRQGLDPIRERQRKAQEAAEAASRDRTFQAAAEAVIEAKAPGWKNAKHADQWKATLAAHAYPVLGTLPVTEIGTDDVLRVLRPIWTKTPETASRVRGRIEAVIDYATARGWRRGDNPARWTGLLAQLLPARRDVARVEHHPALPWQQMPAFMAALGERKGMAALALRCAILTAARSGEVRGMTWGEVDAEAGVWTVPPARMKAGRLHRVPLSGAALALLESVRPEDAKAGDLVFPGIRPGKPLSDMSLSMLLRGMATDGLAEGELPRWRDATGRAVVPHAFRSSFRDWAGETRPDGREVVEMALAHTIKDKAEAAYARSDLLEKRRVLMEAWAAWCSRPAGGAAIRDLDAERAKRAAA